MSEPEDFLSRWSKRKRDVAEEAAAETAKPETENAAEVPAGAENANGPALAKSEAGETEKPAFDISKLPSIDEITAQTDIRPFLAAGVPAHLTRAALRKLWVTDPKIRDFIEMAENQWDFSTGNIPGFDYSLPENAKELVAQIFSKANEVVEKANEPAAENEQMSATVQSPVSAEPDRADATIKTEPEHVAVPATHKTVERAEEASRPVAVEENLQADDDPMAAHLPRRHGTALPI